MDLRTIAENLKGVPRGSGGGRGVCTYAKAEDAAGDVRLTLTNAMTYNLPGSRVYNCAKNLGDYFEAQFIKIIKSQNDPGRPPSVEDMTQWVEKCYK